LAEASPPFRPSQRPSGDRRRQVAQVEPGAHQAPPAKGSTTSGVSSG
jgi:hypothetical protein